MHTDDARFLELLERWLMGEFTRSDERELSALAASDPFRREAWEGFLALPETAHQAQLERLRGRLRPPQAKRLPLPRWAAAAAAVLMLGAALYFLPDWDWQRSKSEQALVQPSSAPEQPTQAAPESASTAKSPELPPPAPVASEPAPAKPAPQRPAPQQPAADDLALAEEQIDQPEKKSAGKEAASAAAQDTSPSPLVGGPAANMNSRAKSQPMPAASAPAAGPAGQEVPAGAMQKTIPTPAAAQPAGGWNAFHEYMARNARLPEAARNNNVSGWVRLEFTVGPDGKPANVRVVRGLGYGCDEIAMRLLSQFQFDPPTLNPVAVDIPFVR